ncbi:hypothetical protein VNO78_07744 [Psophocarpus tetragonolobus]|uniref:Uncharacterized protein n=1 Tax=Psophocarpus tetragonolobus TaxID=3891 RepID=A0AAN9SUQ9_PSOTE
MTVVDEIGAKSDNCSSLREGHESVLAKSEDEGSDSVVDSIMVEWEADSDVWLEGEPEAINTCVGRIAATTFRMRMAKRTIAALTSLLLHEGLASTCWELAGLSAETQHPAACVEYTRTAMLLYHERCGSAGKTSSVGSPNFAALEVSSSRYQPVTKNGIESTFESRLNEGSLMVPSYSLENSGQINSVRELVSLRWEEGGVREKWRWKYNS